MTFEGHHPYNTLDNLKHPNLKVLREWIPSYRREDFNRSLALPPEFDLGVMGNRWVIGASDERLEIYQHFKKGFLEGYQPDINRSEGWEARASLFCALESLERIYNRGAREHLSHYILR